MENNFTISKSPRELDWMSDEFGTIYITKDYDAFNNMLGNRNAGGHAKRIEDSIKKYGYIPFPIIINEKCEICDGQARFYVLEKLGIPVPYICIPGLTLEYVKQLNTAVTTWSTDDHLYSGKILGNSDMNIFYDYIKKYETFGLRKVANYVATGRQNCTNQIKRGNLSFIRPYEECQHIMDFMVSESIMKFIKKYSGSFRGINLVKALIFIYENNNQCKVDLGKLSERISNYPFGNITPNGTGIVNAAEFIQNIYNYNIRSGKCNIVSELSMVGG